MGCLNGGRAIDAAIDKYGKDPTTSVAYCAFEPLDNRGGPEHRFWFDLFLTLEKSTHVGRALPFNSPNPIAEAPLGRKSDAAASRSESAASREPSGSWHRI